MGRPKGSKNKKDKFESIPSEWRDAVAGGSAEDIRARIAEVALNQEELSKAQENDEDLSNLKEQVKVASEGYRDGTKMNRLKIQFAKRVLEDKSLDAGTFDPNDGN